MGKKKKKNSDKTTAAQWKLKADIYAKIFFTLLCIE